MQGDHVLRVPSLGWGRGEVTAILPNSLLGNACFLTAVPQVKRGGSEKRSGSQKECHSWPVCPAVALAGAPKTETTGKCNLGGPEASPFPKGSISHKPSHLLS